LAGALLTYRSVTLAKASGQTFPQLNPGETGN